ncbi:uncharacterized protein At2g24330 [Elaeis guineensis]|uniref:Uncharacterized protein At2g24330 n=1 Tax=Elaeis guineensis var. tenera TaxID=51953 RepID=A0A6I9SB63_ELAGV|nr:uncharacterized protein At2g24330 [Elaeis guineensis]
MAEDAGPASGVDPVKSAANSKKEGEPVVTLKKQRGGFVSRLWKGIFGTREDFEKRLQYLSKEEALVHARLKRRAQTSRKVARNTIVLSVILEVLAVAYAVTTTRSVDLNWQMRAIRVLPMFVLPGLSAAFYSTLVSFTRMFDHKDQKTLEKLRAERQAKIDELKERTNYYTTQQLIQRYDLDPAAKAAAATVLASKLGSDSGLKIFVGDESNISSSLGKSNDVELVQPTGLRNRKPSHARSHSTGSGPTPRFVDESFDEYGADAQEASASSQRVVEHYKGSGPHDGGWLARIAALLVGEDPTQCYALICGNCHMHNGLARKEDFLYITYYCPHCGALNGSRQPEEHEISSSSGKSTPTSPVDGSSGNYKANNMSSISGNVVKSSLATVEELPGGETDEKELDPHAS